MKPETCSDPVLPTDSEERKGIPIFSGVLNYFPLAIAAVARLSKRGNDKHNPGEPLHWAREKSTDQEDCIARHLIDINTINAAGEYEDATALAWRALAKLQVLEEQRLGKPMSRASRISGPVQKWLFCPSCNEQHVDEGEWATRPHKTHQCQVCTHEWRPYPYPTVGV